MVAGWGLWVPVLVRAAVGEDVTQEELGGSRVHTRKSGVGDLEVASDEECIAVLHAVNLTEVLERMELENGHFGERLTSDEVREAISAFFAARAKRQVAT